MDDTTTIEKDDLVYIKGSNGGPYMVDSINEEDANLITIDGDVLFTEEVDRLVLYSKGN